MKRDRIPYDVITTDENVNYSSGTIKLLGCAKGIVSVVMALAIIIDIVTLALLASRESANINYIIPIIMIVIDVAFVVASAFANFKFRYSNYIWIGYCISAIVLPIATTFISTIGGEIATSVSIAINLTIHVISAAMVILVVSSVRKKSNFKSAIIGIIAALVMIVSLIGVSVYYGEMGVWGQRSPRVVVYESGADGYCVVDVLPGKSDTVVIPSTFNGVPVVSIDTSVFTDSDAINFDIKGVNKLTLLSIEDMSSLDKPINIMVDKNLIDVYRDEFYSLATRTNWYNSGVQNVINGFSPNNLTELEVYIEFEYDLNNMPKREIIDKLTPSIICEKGSLFDYRLIDGALKSLIEDERYADLAWAYNSSNRRILKESARQALTKQQKLTDNVSFAVTFEDVYRVSLTESNDSKFFADESWTTSDIYGFKGKYLTTSGIDNIYNSLPTREGFSVINAVGETDTNNSTALIEALRMNGNNEVSLTQTWTMNAPNITSIRTDKVNYVYGDRINMLINADRKDFDYHYSIVSPDGTITYSMKNITEFVLSELALPQNSGSYTLNVFATNENSDLQSNYTILSQNINIKKRTLDIKWTIPNNNVFDNNVKIVTCLIDATLIFNNDSVSLDDYSYAYLDANKYDIQTNLTEYWSDKYALSDSSKISFTILPKEVIATWSVSEYIYNSLPQSPSATAKDLYNGSLPIMISGAKVNAGSNYIATAISENTNYKITNNTQIFAIAKKEYIPRWDNSLLIYNGASQAPAKAYGEGDIANEAYSKVTNIEYNGNINVGSYTAKASLPSNSNFYIADNNAKVSYMIDKRGISVKYTNNAFVYDGTLKFPTFNFVNIITGDEETLRNTMNYNGKGINVGRYNVSMTLPNKSNYYLALTTETQMNITPRTLNITIEDIVKDYDGKISGNFKLNVTNLAASDVLEQILTYVYTGTAIGAKNVGVYVIDINYSAAAKYGNYTLNIKQGKLTIQPKTVNLAWANSGRYVVGASEIAPKITSNGGIDSSLITLKYFTKAGVLLSGKPTTVGSYKVEAVIDGNNYVLVNYSQSYDIVAKEVK